jgi:hypothetical protein
MNHITKSSRSITLAVAIASSIVGCAGPETPAEEMGSTESHVTANPGSADKITLVRSFRSGFGHWASVRSAPPGFIREMSYTIRLRGQRALFACGANNHNFLSLDPNCEGLEQQGFIGYADQDAQGARQALFRCYTGEDHFISTDAACEGYTNEVLLGWVEDVTAIPPPAFGSPCKYDYECPIDLVCNPLAPPAGACQFRGAEASGG